MGRANKQLQPCTDIDMVTPVVTSHRPEKACILGAAALMHRNLASAQTEKSGLSAHPRATKGIAYKVHCNSYFP
jgi:hypothetical protein